MIAVLVTGVTLLAVNDQVALAVLVGLGGSLAFVVAAVWFTTRTLLVPPALMLEGKKFWPTITRAWRLTRRSFWRLFGIYLLTTILAGIIAQIIVFPAHLIAQLVLGDPTGRRSARSSSSGSPRHRPDARRRRSSPRSPRCCTSTSGCARGPGRRAGARRGAEPREPVGLGGERCSRCPASTLSTTFVSSVVALLYIDVRMRREGLDVELARAAETTA